MTSSQPSTEDSGTRLREPRLSLRDLIKIMAVGFILAMLAMIVFGVISIDGAKRSASDAKAAAGSAKIATDQANEDRAKNSKGSCVQFNVNQLNNRVAIAQSIRDSLQTLVSTEAGQAFIDQLYAAQTEKLKELLPYRDCSDAGIATFLQHPPPDPAG